jgi:hypothetical protein
MDLVVHNDVCAAKTGGGDADRRGEIRWPVGAGLSRSSHRAGEDNRTSPLPAQEIEPERRLLDCVGPLHDDDRVGGRLPDRGAKG